MPGEVKKLFVVSVETEMAVYAENREQAEDLARRHLCATATDSYLFAFFARELTDIHMIDSELAESLPWGGDDDRSVQQIFDETQRGK